MIPSSSRASGRQALTPVKAEPLSAEAFAPFGDLVSWEGSPPDHVDGVGSVFSSHAYAKRIDINQGYTTRFHNLFAHKADGGELITSMFRGRPRPLEVRMMERHPLGSQAFVPLGGLPWYVVVALGEERPESFGFFLAHGAQAVNYAPGIWHHPLLLDRAQDFLIIDRAGPGNNLEEQDLPEGYEIVNRA